MAQVQNLCSSCMECESRAPALTERSHALLTFCPQHGLAPQKHQHGWRTPKLSLWVQISDMSLHRMARFYESQ